MRRRLFLTTVAVVAVTLLAACEPTPAPSGALTMARDYGNCSLPEPPEGHLYRTFPDLRLDVFKHIGPTSVGTIMFIHGGGFVHGTRRGSGGVGCNQPDQPDLASLNMGAIMKQRENGWDIVSIDYRLMTDASSAFPGALIDSVEALRWLKGLGGQLVGLNRSKVIVVGHSAGGTLAALLAGYAGRTFAGGTFPTFDGWVGISAPLAEGGAVAGNDSIFTSWTRGGWFEGQRDAAVPSKQLRSTSPLGYLIHGTNDPVVSIEHSRTIRSLFPNRITVDEVWPGRNKPGENNDSDHWAIGGADYNRLTNWLLAR